jgi:hypothetical protein
VHPIEAALDCPFDAAFDCLLDARLDGSISRPAENDVAPLE